MKDLFVITNISPVFPSVKPDSVNLTPELKAKYSGINCKMTFKRVINLNQRIIGQQSLFMHFGNSNPNGKYFSKYIKGIKNDNGKMWLDSEIIIKGVVIEIEYSTKEVGETTHLVPLSEPKIVEYINLEKVKKSDDKITTLF